MPFCTLVILSPFILIPSAFRVGPLVILTEVKFGLVFKPIWKIPSAWRMVCKFSPEYSSLPDPQPNVVKMPILFVPLLRVVKFASAGFKALLDKPPSAW